jgi:hypothetical protein
MKRYFGESLAKDDGSRLSVLGIIVRFAGEMIGKVWGCFGALD